MNFERKRESSKFEALRTRPIVSVWIANCCIEHHFSLLECIIKTHGMPNKIFARRANDIMFSQFRFAGFVLKISFSNFVWRQMISCFPNVVCNGFWNFADWFEDKSLLRYFWRKMILSKTQTSIGRSQRRPRFHFFACWRKN